MSECLWGDGALRTLPPLLGLVNNVSLINPSLYLSFTRGGVTPWMMRQSTVEAYHGNFVAKIEPDCIKQFVFYFTCFIMYYVNFLVFTHFLN